VSHAFAASGTRTVTLRVRDADGWTATVSHPIVVAIDALPDTATAVGAAQSGASSAVLRWSPPKNPGTGFVTGYRVSRDGTDLAGAGPWATTVSATARSFTFTNLRSSTAYALAVQPITTAGTGLPVTVSTPISATSALSAPAASVAESAAGSVTITWSPPSVTAGRTVTGYRVSRDGVDASGAGAYATVVAATTRSFTMTNLVVGSTYALSVQAVTSGGTGPAAKGAVKLARYVGAPTTTTVAQTAAATARISWALPATASGQTIVGYRVTRDGVDAAGTGAYSALVPASARSYTLTRLVVGAAYTVTVQAVTSAAISAPASGRVTVTY
jgi:hypothetical protein